MCAALARWLVWRYRRIGSGLLFRLGVQFGSDDQDDHQYPDPGNEANHGAERAICGVVGSEVADIPAEQHRDDGCHYYRQQGSERNLFPRRLIAARAPAVSRRDPCSEHGEHAREGETLDQLFRTFGKPEIS